MPVYTLDGAAYNGQVRLYAIPADDDNAYYRFDLVALAGSNDTATGVANVTLSSAGGGPHVGVVIAAGTASGGTGGGAGGPLINPQNLDLTTVPTSKTVPWYVAVADDPNLIFEIQEGGTGTNLTAATGVGNANILYAAGTYFSGTTLNNGSVATTADLDLKIMQFVQRVDNHFVTSPATGGGSQKWNVMINNHAYKYYVVGA
ncbi:MAG: hypothetical protein ACREF7_00785 [Candidatus Saccharimonadales bacterium]